MAGLIIPRRTRGPAQPRHYGQPKGGGARLAPKKASEKSGVFSNAKKRGAELSENETELALLKQEVGFLKTEIDSIKTDVKDKFDRIEKKLDEALAGKPTWGVALIVAGLMTTCTGLIVYNFTRVV